MSSTSGKFRRLLSRSAARLISVLAGVGRNLRLFFVRGAGLSLRDLPAIGRRAAASTLGGPDKDLWLIGLATVLLAVVIAVSPAGAARIVLGLPFLLFFPGYTLVAALFHRKGSLGGVERVALSFGLSIAVVPLIGLILNFTPWGIRLDPVLISIAFFIIVASGVAAYRRDRLLPEERFAVRFSIRLPSWQGQGRIDRVLSIVLVVAILGSLATLGYVLASPRVGERFTEFYILGPGGKAENYPTRLNVGEEGRVIIGIVNREHEPASYSVEIWINGKQTRLTILGEDMDEVTVELEHGRKWERMVGFVPQTAGRQKVEFVLYRDGEPYFESPLHLWVEVEDA